jgi:CPA2 family monovalent cation:H+ antiporter-2
MHETPLITTLVAGFVLAFLFGTVANRFRLPPLVGYLIAGILVGPYTPGYVADQSLALELAEIGVILLMFGVGLHFSLKDLLSVRFIAVPGAIAQMGFATGLGWLIGRAMGWGHGGSLVFGLALSVASTVVLLKALQERRIIDTERGRIAVGWLIVEDLAMVMALVLIPAVAGVAGGDQVHADPTALELSQMLGFDIGVGGMIALTLLKVAGFIGFMLIFGRKLIPWILHHIAHTGSRELFRLGVLAIALGVAFGAARLFGVSLALGAFFAGMILSESPLSHRAAQESLPLRDAFAVLFFVSVGMLFDPASVLRDPLPVLAVVAVIVFGKSVAALLIVIAFRKTAGTALTISASLAQIGEFSFILAELGVGLGLMPAEGRDLVLAGAIISIILNPLVFWLCDRARPWFEARLAREDAANGAAGQAAPASEPDEVPVQAPTALSGHTIVVGHGRVGSIVAEAVRGAGKPLLVIEDSEKRIETLRREGVEAVVGNAVSADILALANLAGAKTIVVAIPDAFEAGQVTAQARAANPSIVIVARAHSDDEIDHLVKFGADVVIMGEREIARGMVDYIAGQVSGEKRSAEERGAA